MRVGFLGAGAIALEHAKAARALGHEIAAASARSPDSPRWLKFKSAFPEARLMDGEALLKTSDLDAFVSCLSWDATQGWLPRILACPKPILIEKPASLETAPLREALARFPKGAANKRVGYNRRFYEPVQALKERLSRGGLKSAEVTISEDVASHAAKHGKGIIPHLALFSSHVLDLTLHLFGPLKAVKTYARPEKGEAAPYVSLSALLEGAGGVPVWLTANADDSSPVGIRGRFDDGETWHLAPLEVLKVYRGYEIIPADEKTNIRRYVPRLKREVPAAAEHKPGFLAQMKAFLDGGEGATLEESVELVELVDELYARTPARAS